MSPGRGVQAECPDPDASWGIVRFTLKGQHIRANIWSIVSCEFHSKSFSLDVTFYG